MTELVINNDKTKGRIKDVVFAYVKLQSGSYKYQSNTELEYCVDCIVPKDVAKAYKKMFPKNGYREIDTDEFKEKYKIDPPFPGDEQFIIKLKSNANLKADVPSANLSIGDLVPYEWTSRPKVFIPVDGGVKDVTMDVLVANGSKGDVAFNINTNTFGTFPQLSGILVNDLTEYEQKGSGSDFGEVVGGLNPGDGKPQQVPTDNMEGKTPQTNNTQESPMNFDPDSIPF